MSLDSADLSWIFADGLIGANLDEPSSGSLCAVAPISRHASSTDAYGSFFYRLRPNLRWHDGKPLVAQDIVDCFERVRRSPIGSVRPYRLVKRIVPHSDLTFSVFLRELDPLFPRAFFGPLGSPGVPLVRPGRFPIGTGPFRITNHRPDRTSFDRWAGSPRGTPRVSGLTLSYLADNNTQDMLIQTGEVDVALGADPTFVLPHNIRYVRRVAGAGYLLLNASTLPQTVRTAVAQSIDRKAILRKIYRGWAQPLHSILPAGTPGAEIADPWQLDVEGARAFFKAHRSRKLTIATAPGNAERMALLVQSQLHDVGAEAELRRYAPIEYFAPGGPLRSGRFDIAISGDIASLDPDLLATWGCSARPPEGNNFSRLCDRRFDDAVREHALSRAMHTFWADAVAIPLADYVWCIAFTSRVRGISQITGFAASVYTIPEWRLA
ncbi:MAG TPA: ABC transporter substrate-binding protein [Candidatus Baltobacteraceae bacterium]